MIVYEILVLDNFLLFLLGRIILGGLLESLKIEVECFLFILKFE